MVALEDAVFLLGFGYSIGLTRPASMIALRYDITLIIKRRRERGGRLRCLFAYMHDATHFKIVLFMVSRLLLHLNQIF